MKTSSPLTVRKLATHQSAAILIVVAGLVICGCSDKQMGQSQMDTVQPPPTAPIQTSAQRIAEIDRLLSKPLTGRSDDADQRTALKNERAALTGVSNYGVVRNQPIAIHKSEQS